MSRYGYYRGWAPYVPVAQRRKNAELEMAKMVKKGQKIEPVNIKGRKIATTFWGRGWCEHLEAFGDHSNRLPRGRTYVRNGSVCHLVIEDGKVDALVSGSQLYQVKVRISALKPAKWNLLKQSCRGQIGSLFELLQGRLSDGVMETVTHTENGLFPLSKEIRFECDCPDYAGMCKHIAAVMYGIGARLDQQPELLFVLRGVDHEELIVAGAAVEALVQAGSGGSRRRRTSASLNIAEVFEVELDRAETSSSSTGRKSKKVVEQVEVEGDGVFVATGWSVSALRERHRMTRKDFAEVLGVSAVTVSRWEGAHGALRLKAESLAALEWLDQEEVVE